jgi:choline dehydrogenase
MPPLHKKIIIVGGGSAGCVLARRLTDPDTEPAVEVTLIETGRDNRTSERPAHMVSPNPGAVINDDVWSFPQLKSRRAAGQGPALYWRGRGLGGSSAINGMQAIRGTPEDFDAWEGLMGCTGWGAEDVLPYFKKFEKDLDFGDTSDAHSADGLLPIQRLPSADRAQWGPVDRAFYQAAVELGWPEVPDHNAFERGADGVSPFARNDVLEQGARRSGHATGRVSVYDAFVDAVRDDESRTLKILTGAHVHRVLFDGTKANGVLVALPADGDGGAAAEPVELAADEVFLCAGAVHTPALLQRSGVGPRQQLSQLGVDKVVADIQGIGQNFQDHPGIRLNIPLKPGAQLPHGGFRHIGVVGRYTSGVPNTGLADMQVVALNGGGDFESTNDGSESAAAFAKGGVVIWINECFSTGSVACVSTDPLADPVVEENMLSDPRDVARLRKAGDVLFEVAETPAIAGIVADGQSPVLALTSGVGWGGSAGVGKVAWAAMSVAEQDAFVVANCFDCQHASGTCRMGDPSTDPSAVVDCRSGEVAGLSGLRVVDASLLPLTVRGNIHLTVLMVAEKLASAIKQEYALAASDVVGAESSRSRL